MNNQSDFVCRAGRTLSAFFRCCVSVCLVAALWVTTASAQPQDYAWQPGFHVAGVGGGDGNPGSFGVSCNVTFDDGTGPALYVGGWFSSVGNTPISNVAKYLGGNSWGPVGVGLPGAVIDLEVVPTPSGDRLFALVAGLGPVEWNGVAWTAWTAGLPLGGQQMITDLEVFPEPGGEPTLYASWAREDPIFIHPGRIFRFDGTSWSEASNAGLTWPASKLFSRRAANGTYELVCGTGFFVGNPVIAGYVHVTSDPRSGGTWTQLGEQLPVGIRAIQTYTGPDGVEDLYVGGITWRVSPAAPVHGLRRWRNNSWEPVGSPAHAREADVFEMRVLDLGQGPRLVAVGNTGDEAPSSQLVAAWDGSAWTRLTPYAPTNHLGGRRGTIGLIPGTNDVFFGGEFVGIGASTMPGMAVHRNGVWEPATERGHGLTGIVDQLSACPSTGPGTRPRLFVGGSRVYAGTSLMRSVFSWDNVSLQPTPGLSDVDRLFDVMVAQTPDGPECYSLGVERLLVPPFSNGVFLTRWDGNAWNSIGDNPVDFDGGGPSAMAWFDGAIHLAGEFYFVDGDVRSGVVRRTSNGWVPLPGTPSSNIIAALDDGSGPTLYVANTGAFPSGVHRLQNGSWQRIGTFQYTERVHDMCIFEGQLYVAGNFARMNDVIGTFGLARFDGSAWSPVGAGLNVTSVNALHVFDDGSGEKLFAAGDLVAPDGSRGVARWDNAAWSGVDGGIAGIVGDLATFPDELGPAMYASGAFTRAGDTTSINLAKFARARPACPADWNRDSHVSTQDFFDFLSVFILGRADANADGNTDASDFFYYLELFFVGCP